MGCSESRDVYPLAMKSAYSGGNLSTAIARSGAKVIRIPLTEREIYSITKSWKTISSNMINCGKSMFLKYRLYVMCLKYCKRMFHERVKTDKSMFLKMFETSADVRNMFEQFRTVDNLNDLLTSRALENHALLVMNALDEAITNLDDEPYLIEMLLTTGKSHRRFENFGPHIFWAIEEPFLSSVRQTLADKSTPRMEKIYRKAIRFILETLIIGFQEDIDIKQN